MLDITRTGPIADHLRPGPGFMKQLEEQAPVVLTVRWKASAIVQGRRSLSADARYRRPCRCRGSIRQGLMT